MQNGCCPKCGQSDVHARDLSPNPADPASPGLRQSIYVCLGCGYTETYTHPNDVVAIRADGRWRSVARQAVTGQTIKLSAAPAAGQRSKSAPNNQCPWCGSTKIIKRARVRDSRSTLSDVVVEIEANPDALLFSGAIHGTLRARICGRCGYAQFFSGNVQALYAAFLEAEA